MDRNGRRKCDLEVSAGGIVFRQAPGDPVARFLLIKDSYGNWGFPKGHLEDGETPAAAALRETEEETGLCDLAMQGPIRVIDWHFRFRGRHIHKYCHFFLLESPGAETCPQLEEGITDCRWSPLDEALQALSYENARGVLKRAGEMVRTLTAVGAGRPRRPPELAPRGEASAPRADTSGPHTGTVASHSDTLAPRTDAAAPGADASAPRADAVVPPSTG